MNEMFHVPSIKSPAQLLSEVNRKILITTCYETGHKRGKATSKAQPSF